MANVILDTNIYGKIIEDKRGIELAEKLIKDDKFVIHNFKTIRDELRRAKNVLKVYDRIVKTRLFNDTKEIDGLAKNYFREYKKFGGRKQWTRIKNDFKIIAYASIKNCDLVFSNDEKTLKNSASLKSYRMVNLNRKLRTPTFYKYEDLKRSYSLID